MTEIQNINQDLQMIIQKRSRCEDWVASVAFQEQTSVNKVRGTEYVGIDPLDDFSDRSFTDECAKRHQRKANRRFKLDLNLLCEWRDCVFMKTTSQSVYFQHLKCHEYEPNVLGNYFHNECYECQWKNCNFDTTERDQMKRHITYHGYHSLLKSLALQLHEQWDFPLCKLESENRNLLPDLPYPFECGASCCDFTTNYFQSYLNHINEHLTDLNFGADYRMRAKCFWKSCSFTCRTRNRMKSHLKFHSGAKAAACCTCGATFATNTKYVDHCTRQTPVLDEANRCQYCLRYFANERLLRDHLRYHINRHKCPFCEITCSTPAVLANHIRFKHIKDRPFKCNECSFQSVKADDCISHMSIHDPAPKYKCQAKGCRFACAALRTFNNHFRSVHLMLDSLVYCCHLCDKEYKRGTLLGKHLRSVHKLERPPGHSRFRYMEGIDGKYRLQIERYESIEVDNVNVNVDVDVDVTNANDKVAKFILKYQQSDVSERVLDYSSEEDGKSLTDKRCSAFAVTVEVDADAQGREQGEEGEAGAGAGAKGEGEEETDECGALIAIDEIDEAGRIFRTSTVRERFVGAAPPSTSPSLGSGPGPSRYATSGDKSAPCCDEGDGDGDVDVDEEASSATASTNSVVLPRHVRVTKGKTRRKVLSDVDVSANVVVVSLADER